MMMNTQAIAMNGTINYAVIPTIRMKLVPTLAISNDNPYDSNKILLENDASVTDFHMFTFSKKKRKLPAKGWTFYHDIACAKIVMPSCV